MRTKNVNALSLLLVTGVLLAACRTSSGGAPPNAAVVGVTANTSLTQWLQSAVNQFNKTGAKTASGKVTRKNLN